MPCIRWLPPVCCAPRRAPRTPSAPDPTPPAPTTSTCRYTLAPVPAAAACVHRRLRDAGCGPRALHGGLGARAARAYSARAGEPTATPGAQLLVCMQRCSTALLRLLASPPASSCLYPVASSCAKCIPLRASFFVASRSSCGLLLWCFSGDYGPVAVLLPCLLACLPLLWPAYASAIHLPYLPDCIAHSACAGPRVQFLSSPLASNSTSAMIPVCKYVSLGLVLSSLGLLANRMATAWVSWHGLPNPSPKNGGMQQCVPQDRSSCKCITV